MKRCPKCKIEKDSSEFYLSRKSKDNLSSRCKVCAKEAAKIWANDNKDRHTALLARWRKTHPEYSSNYTKRLRDTDPDKLRHYSKTNYIKHRDRRLEVGKAWREANSEYISAYRKSPKSRQQRAAYARNKRQNDSEYRLIGNLRCRIRDALKNTSKSAKTHVLLGCNINDLKTHLQATARANGHLEFDINNYSGHEYHIDHVIPCAAFTLTCSYHQRLCFNYTNLQILTAKENLTKQAKMLDLELE